MTGVCPQCAAPCGEADKFCSRCGVALASPAPAPPAPAQPMARQPGAPPPAKPPPAPAPPAPSDESERAAAIRIPLAPPPVADGPICPQCGLQNFAGRDECVKCGALLHRPAAPPTMASPASRPTSRLTFEPLEATAPIPKVTSTPKRTRSRALAVVAVAVVVVLGVVAALVASRGDDEPKDVATAAQTTLTTVAPVPAKVDPATITASASSTLPDEPPYTYGVKNTLDGNPETAWNDGAPGSGAGEKLTYKFARPVRLTSIRLINGYASNPTLFQQNARLRNVVLVTEAGRFPFTIGDVFDRQQFDIDFGRTSSLVIEVVSVYPGTKYEDLALSEIEFYGVPA